LTKQAQQLHQLLLPVIISPIAAVAIIIIINRRHGLIVSPRQVDWEMSLSHIFSAFPLFSPDLNNNFYRLMALSSRE
jgi:hypothetical protein